jgi:hypothetical protein
MGKVDTDRAAVSKVVGLRLTGERQTSSVAGAAAPATSFNSGARA